MEPAVVEKERWLEIEDRGAIRWLTINRPSRRNAIPPTGWAELANAIRAFEESSSRVLVFAGAGGAFCSGADLDQSMIDGEGGIAEHHAFMLEIGEAAMALHRCAKPTIAAVDGIAAGAGLNLALGCDIVLASTRGRFSEIFVRRGLTVDFGGTWLLPRAVGPQRAKEMALSGRIVEAAEAAAIGLVMETVEVARLEARVMEVAESFVAGAPIGQAFAKQGINRAFEVSFADAVAWESQAQAICFLTADMQEGVAAFLEKRAPGFTGH